MKKVTILVVIVIASLIFITKTFADNAPYYDVNLDENYDGLMMKDNKPFSGKRTLYSSTNEKVISLEFSNGYLESEIWFKHTLIDGCIKPCGITRIIIFHDAITLRDYKYGQDNYRKDAERRIRYRATVIDYDNDGTKSESLWINDNIKGNCQIGSRNGPPC